MGLLFCSFSSLPPIGRIFLKKLVHGSTPRFFIGDFCLPNLRRFIAFRFSWLYYNRYHPFCQYPFLLFHNVKIFKNLLTKQGFRVIMFVLGSYGNPSVISYEKGGSFVTFAFVFLFNLILLGYFFIFRLFYLC